jgi:uncharacterized protein YycO
MSGFKIGNLVMTHAVNNMVLGSEQFAKDVTSAFGRYIRADWGDMCRDDKKSNDSAVKSGLDRILAAYKTSEGKIYIITEADRSYTILLFADEY